jgi:hypothetical protein
MPTPPLSGNLTIKVMHGRPHERDRFDLQLNETTCEYAAQLHRR